MRAAFVKLNWAPTRFKPRSMVCAIGPTVLAQPKGSSIFIRQRCEIARPRRLWFGVPHRLCRRFGAFDLLRHYISAIFEEVADGDMAFATRFSASRAYC